MSGEENIRYVATGNPTGWAAMAKTIREVDEDKVKDYKEDIDTLLVFTGLFSAVLTAFVIVSYASLSPDKQDTVIQLLGQIATQTNSYTITSGVINSTIPPQSQLSLTKFDPPLGTLQVNYLWFASLVLTLITASFSMLVKQWLREYLAFEYTSPRERLRARQFRHSGLVTWKVYEIAGFLPLLLQLALGLFLLGLCFFTWSDDHGIGTMCAVLVGFWAFLFVSATVAPIASARCPYKTALLKSILATLRRRCRNLLYRSSLSAGVQLLSNAMTLGIVPDQRLQVRLAKSLLEESDAVKRDTDELAILREVDSFLLDDDLLGTTIHDSLVQNYTSPPDIIKFVLQALALRIKGNELAQLTQPLTRPPDLQRLTKGAWIAISDIVASTVLSGLRGGAAAAGSWVQDAIYLLLAVSERPLTPRAGNAVVHFIQKTTLPHVTRALRMLASLPTTAGRLHDLLDPISQRIHDLLAQGAQPADVVDLVISLLGTETRQSAQRLPLKSILDLSLLSAPMWQFSSNVLGSMIDKALGPDHDSQTNGPWLEDACHILLSPSTYPLTTSGANALARLCSSEKPRARFAACMRPLASPYSGYFTPVLSRLGEVCRAMTDDSSVCYLLLDITLSIPCTSQCTHGFPTSVPLLLPQHLLQHDEWAKHFTSILVERSRTLLTAEIAWPPGSNYSLWTLMSLPTSYHSVNPEIPEIVFEIICNVDLAASAMRPLLSVDSQRRSYVDADAAIRCIASLVSQADTEGRRKFIYAMWESCNLYLRDDQRNKYKQIELINLVRYFNLASIVHLTIRTDNALAEDWIKYYKTWAQAIFVFKEIKCPFLLAEEIAHTSLLAENCLDRLTHLEPSTEDFDEWEANFDINKSVLPDAIFEALVPFIADIDAIAHRCKRVRRLQSIGTLPASAASDVSNTARQHVGS